MQLLGFTITRSGQPQTSGPAGRPNHRKIIGQLLGGFFMVLTVWHSCHIFSLFEPDSQFLAWFIAIGVDLGIAYAAYVACDKFSPTTTRVFAGVWLAGLIATSYGLNVAYYNTHGAGDWGYGLAAVFPLSLAFLGFILPGFDSLKTAQEVESDRQSKRRKSARSGGLVGWLFGKQVDNVPTATAQAVKEPTSKTVSTPQKARPATSAATAITTSQPANVLTFPAPLVNESDNNNPVAVIAEPSTITNPEPDYTAILDNWLKSTGYTRDKVKQAITRWNLTSPDLAYQALTYNGMLPETIDRPTFDKLYNLVMSEGTSTSEAAVLCQGCNEPLPAGHKSKYHNNTCAVRASRARKANRPELTTSSMA